MSAQQDVDVAAPVPSEQAPVAGLNPPQAREPGRDPQSGLDRRRIRAWYAAFAGYAALLAVFSRHADQSWGIWASGGYLLAAITAVSYRGSRGRAAALLIARAGRRHQALRRAVFAVTTPVLALPLAVGITDPPVLALFCVALACLGAGPAARGAVPRAAGLRGLVSPHRIRPSRPAGAALAIGIACAMKVTAWPALPVIAVMIAARDGRRAAWRFVAASA